MNLSEALAEIERLEAIIDDMEGNGGTPLDPGTEHLWTPVTRADLKDALDGGPYRQWLTDANR